MRRKIELTSDERRAVSLPSDAGNARFGELCASRSVARAPYVSIVTLRSLPQRGVAFFDAVEGGSIVVTVVAEASTSDAKPADVLFGCAASLRLVHAALDALPEGDTVAVAWHGRYSPLSFTAGTLTAYVMPLRCCQHARDFGTYYEHGRPCVCACRDCAAGRRWGWR